MKDDAKRQERAEEFADRMEGAMRDLGSTGDFFCDAQRERWRQHSVRAYLGISPAPEAEDSSSTEG